MCPPSSSTQKCASIFRSEEHTSELQSQSNLVCRLLLEKKIAVPVRKSARPLAALRRGISSSGMIPPPKKVGTAPVSTPVTVKYRVPSPARTQMRLRYYD